MNNLLTYIPLIIGSIAAVVAFVLYLNKKKELAFCYKVTGTIVSIEETKSSGGHMIKHPVVQYQSESGETLEYKSTYGSSNWKINEGDQLNLFIHRKEPNRIEIENLMAQWGLPLFFGFAAFMGIIIIPILMSIT